MSLSRPSHLYAYSAALFAVFVWGAFPTLIKSALQFASVEEFLTMRFLVSCMLFLFVFPRVFTKIKQIPFILCAIFIITVVVVFYSQTYALNQMPASWYVAVFTFVPIVFMVIDRQSLNILGLIGTAIAILGMLLFFMSMSHETKMNFWHIILLIFSMLAWVGYSLMAKQLHPYIHDRELVALTSLVGLLSSLTIWAIHGFHMQPISLPGLGLCALSGIVLPLALVTYSFSLRFKPVFAVFSQYLEPVIGLVVAALFLGERMQFLQYAVTLIVIIGTVLIGIATREIGVDV